MSVRARVLAVALLAAVVAVSSALARSATNDASAYTNVAKQTPATIKFSFSVKGPRLFPRGQDRKVERARLGGSGTLALPDTPQEGVQSSGTSATGSIFFHRWKVVGRRVIDEDNVSLEVLSGQYYFTQKRATLILQLKVTKLDPKQTDPFCPVGSTTGIGLTHGRIAGKPDNVGIAENCGGTLYFVNGTNNGLRTAVKVTIEQTT